jgi:hypothetical protein
MTIPANIDHVAIVEDLKKWGLADQKIEIICGLSRGYISHVRAGHVRQMIYQRAARLYNFWFDEVRLRAESIQTQAASTV